MFQRYIEYREMKQLRKEHLAQQKRRYTIIFLALLSTLLVTMWVIEAIGSAAPAKSAPVKPTPAKPIPTISPANQQEIQDIQEFADVVTKPMDELTPEDLTLLNTKAKDPCYEANVMLPPDQMINAISECKSLK